MGDMRERRKRLSTKAKGANGAEIFVRGELAGGESFT